jgi:hypothetical protein
MSDKKINVTGLKIAQNYGAYMVINNFYRESIKLEYLRNFYLING